MGAGGSTTGGLLAGGSITGVLLIGNLVVEIWGTGATGVLDCPGFW